MCVCVVSRYRSACVCVVSEHGGAYVCGRGYVCVVGGYRVYMHVCVWWVDIGMHVCVTV